MPRKRRIFFDNNPPPSVAKQIDFGRSGPAIHGRAFAEAARQCRAKLASARSGPAKHAGRSQTARGNAAQAPSAHPAGDDEDGHYRQP